MTGPAYPAALSALLGQEDHLEARGQAMHALCGPHTVDLTGGLSFPDALKTQVPAWRQAQHALGLHLASTTLRQELRYGESEWNAFTVLSSERTMYFASAMLKERGMPDLWEFTLDADALARLLHLLSPGVQITPLFRPPPPSRIRTTTLNFHPGKQVLDAEIREAVYARFPEMDTARPDVSWKLGRVSPDGESIEVNVTARLWPRVETPEWTTDL